MTRLARLLAALLDRLMAPTPVTWSSYAYGPVVGPDTSPAGVLPPWHAGRGTQPGGAQ